MRQASYALGLLDDRLAADYLSGLLALGCQPTSTAQWEQTTKRPAHPALAALLPFFSTDPLQVRAVSGTGQDPLPPRDVQPAPRPEWISRLMASGRAPSPPMCCDGWPSRAVRPSWTPAT
ncbi:hypothetical protein GCM10022214_52170 [Actinomadura miaoliensis]|uniref:Uncharacterized protein n=1 Tax=Actinomadura miaoliensis TaxID=430685 RepID=A0ABP7WC05_9ACTN